MENNRTEKISKPEKDNRRRRINRITRNFFLHIHSPRVHPHSLKPSYTFGFGILLGFLFIILIFTGVTLMFYYTPSVEQAYNSVKDITFVIPGGRIIRNVHRLSAHGMVILVFAHMLRVFYTASYSGKRATNWVIGVAMLILVLLMSFSGYLLPWDQLAFWAITIGSNIAAAASELTDVIGISHIFDPGDLLKKLLIGGQEVGQNALTRFFALHVFFLPLTMLILTGVHLFRIRKDGGLSRPASEESTPSEKWYSWPVMLWVELGLLLILVAVILGLSIIIEAPLLERANPALPENPAKSPWYFLGIQEMVSYSSFTGGILVPLLYIAFLVSIPYIDKEEKYTGHWFSGKDGVKLTLISILISIVIVISNLWIYISKGGLRDWVPGVNQFWVMLINPASIISLLFILYAYLVRKKTGSTRMSAIALFTVSFTALIILTIVGIWFRGPNWDFYWSPSQWPAY